MNNGRTLIDIIESLRGAQDINLFLIMICIAVLILLVTVMGFCALYMICLGLRDLIMTCKKSK